MNYIMEILDQDHNIITTKKTYTLEELRTFYLEEYRNYCYRIYQLVTNIDIYD